MNSLENDQRAAELAARVLCDAGGDDALARLTRIVIEARRGLSAGFIRLGPPIRPAGP